MASADQPPPVTGISELVLEVADMEASRAFYRDLLGFEETLYGEGREGRYWYLIGDSARLGLWTPQTGLAGGRGGAHVHFAFSIADADLDDLHNRLATAGRRDRGPDPIGPPAARSTSPTPTAMCLSSGPRTWPPTPAMPARTAHPAPFANPAGDVSGGLVKQLKDDRGNVLCT